MPQPTYEELERRLAAAESALEAIRSGEVDTVVTEKGSLVLRLATTEHRLRQSEERHRILFERAPVGIEIFDRNGELITVNPACLELFGVEDPKELSGFNLFKDPNLPSLQKENLRLGQTVRYEVEFDFDTVSRNALYTTTRSGTLWIDVLITPTIPLGDGYLVLVQDISDSKRAEKERALWQAREHQVHKMDALSRMAGAIAHHFNNQLGVVLGNLELARKNWSGTAKQAEQIDKAMRAANTAAGLSSQMLSYLGHRSSTDEPVDLSRLCGEHVPGLKAALPEAVSLETELCSPGPVVKADSQQLRALIDQLASNATESLNQAPGTIGIRTSTLAAEALPDGYRFPADWTPRQAWYGCLEVTDTGDGIAEQDLEKIFDPFFTTRSFGRGLGLAIALGAVRIWDGVITVHSIPGRGTTFCILLPQVEEERTETM